MIRSLFFNALAGIAGLWIAARYVPQVDYVGPEYGLLIAGGILGVLLTILKPILNLITFPIRILTLGLSSFLIAMLLVWLMDFLLGIYFPEIGLEITGLIALFWTTLIIWGASVIVSMFKHT
jgi:putative membrane protein